MPSWNIHLEVGERLADKMKFAGKKRKCFLLGCLLPDINNGYVNRVGIKKPHESTHFAYDKKSSLNFYAEYKKEIDAREPVFLGYLLHLYTDGFFNYRFYREINKEPLSEGLSAEEKLSIKHHDFWIYDTNFDHQIGIASEGELIELTKEANRIGEVEIVPSDIMDVERILESRELSNAIKGEKYTYYTKEKLDDILNSMVDSFTKDYLGGENA